MLEILSGVRVAKVALLIVAAVALNALAQTGHAAARKISPFAKGAKDGAPNGLSNLGGAEATDTTAAVPSIGEKTKDAQKLAGYFNIYWDAKAGKIWLEIDKWGTEFLYQTSLPAGVGSNDIGLDRGQMGETRVVRFERTGPKILLMQSNLDFRAVTSDADERAAVRDSFAESALWGFSVAAEDASGGGDSAGGSGGRVLVDATEFFLRDAHHVPEVLARTKQGAFRLDDKRCAFYLARTKNFPLNTEVEATLTFAGENPGRWVEDVTPSPESITVREHHSFVQLPPSGYKTRVYDPRSSFFGISYMDYATPISEPIVKRFTARHRLEKKDPNAAMSEAVQPIVYYLDRGTPEPIRSALLEGANWWPQAFEAAGYQECVSRGDDAGGRGPDGSALQRDPVGASRDARVVVWRGHDRSADGRNYQGAGVAGVAARAAGFFDCGGVAGAVRKRQTRFIEDAGDGARAVAATGGARSGAHAGARTQLFGEHGGAIVGDGLSAAGGDAGRGWRAGFVAGVCDGDRRVGQSVDHMGLFGFCGGRG